MQVRGEPCEQACEPDDIYIGVGRTQRIAKYLMGLLTSHEFHIPAGKNALMLLPLRQDDDVTVPRIALESIRKLPR